MVPSSRVLPGVLAAALLALSFQASGQTPLTLERVASGLASPLYVTAPPGDESRIFIVERGGRIRIVKDGSLLPTPFLTVTGIVSGGERGLLGMAFHPQYANNGFFYVNYTRSGDGATMVRRFRVSEANPDVADPTSAFTILGPILQPYSNHNGGCIKFGPDGYLYIGTGDGGGGGDPQCNAQNGQSLLGKMLRIDVDGGSPYAVPPTNPFAGNPAVRDEIWHLGLRNPWRFSFDRMTGDMYIADVGQITREEINFQPASSTGGENFGWKVMEGTTCFGTSGCAPTVPPCRDPRLTDPIHTYGRGTGRCVTGGYVYRGCAIPDLKGTYFFADFTDSRMWSFRYENGNVVDFRNRTAELVPSSATTNTISSFGEDARGELYVCNLRTGEVFKIVPAAPPPVVDLGYGKVGGNNRIPRFDACGLLTAGNRAEFRLDGAPPSTPSFLLLSTQATPTSLLGGTLVPVPVEIIAVLATDATGRISFDVPGGGGPASIYAQFLVLDTGASFDMGFSNALRVDLQR